MKPLKSTLPMEAHPESLLHFLDRFDKEKMIVIQSGPASPEELVQSLLTYHQNGDQRKTVKFVLKPGPCMAYQEKTEVEVNIRSMESGWNGYYEVWIITFIIPAHYVYYDERCPVHGKLLLKAHYDFKYSSDPNIESGIIFAQLEEERIVKEKQKADLEVVKRGLEKTLEILESGN